MRKYLWVLKFWGRCDEGSLFKKKMKFKNKIILKNYLIKGWIVRLKLDVKWCNNKRKRCRMLK